MKNSKFVAIIIAVVAPIVKWFPSWALKYTKRSNKYAKKFQLSAVDEEKFLLKHPQSAEWIRERIWHLQTRKYFFEQKNSQPALFEAFISNIESRIIFDVAYKIAPEEAIKSKSYTLDADRVIKACNDNVNYLFSLADKQPQSFTVDLVRKLSKDRQDAYFSYLFTKCQWDKMAAFDVLFFEDVQKNENAKNCLSFLLYRKSYYPNLSPEQLSSLGDEFEQWCQHADVKLVLEKMTDFWKKNKNFSALFNAMQRITGKNQNLLLPLLQILRQSEYYLQTVELLLQKGIACPHDFAVLIAAKSELIKQNVELCIFNKLTQYIDLQDIEKLDYELKVRILTEQAENGCLSFKSLQTVKDVALRKKLTEILENNAQVSWFKSLPDQLNDDVLEQALSTIEKYAEKKALCSGIQDLSLQKSYWANVFATRKWYDEAHILKLLMYCSFDSVVQNFLRENKLSQEQYEALLAGPNAALSMEAQLLPEA